MPVSGDPIEDGVVVVRDGRIEEVAEWSSLRTMPLAAVRDLGDAALMPGLVNAHSHLELTVMRGLLEMPDFREWIGRLTDIRLTRMGEEDLLDSARIGALEAARAGVTCCGDTSDSGLPVGALDEAGLRGVVFQEVFGPAPEQVGESMRALGEKLARLENRASDRVRVGVSPHAPYTVSAELFTRVADLAVDRGLAVAIHTAESAAEELFMRNGAGPFAERLAARGIAWHAPQRSTISYLDQLGVLAAQPLLIHAVNATPDDLDAVARTGSRIAHCPKSNAKFAHGVAPLAGMLARGIAVGVGTDSVASNNVCDVLDEARIALLVSRATERVATAVTARSALGLATIGGARALGLEAEIGTLEAGKRADLCAVSLAGVHAAPVYDVEAALVFSSSARDVLLTVVDGEIVFDRGAEHPTLLDEERLMSRLREISSHIGGVR